MMYRTSWNWDLVRSEPGSCSHKHVCDSRTTRNHFAKSVFRSVANIERSLFVPRGLFLFPFNISTNFFPNTKSCFLFFHKLCVCCTAMIRWIMMMMMSIISCRRLFVPFYSPTIWRTLLKCHRWQTMKYFAATAPHTFMHSSTRCRYITRIHNRHLKLSFLLLFFDFFSLVVCLSNLPRTVHNLPCLMSCSSG